MAKGRRDVELVVRARNEASKAVDAITSSLDALTKSQKGAKDSAGQTQSTLSRLGAELGKLGTQIGGVSVFDKLAASSKRAADSVSQMGDRAGQAAAEQARLNREVEKAQAEYNTLAKAVGTANANLRQAKTNTAEAKKAQADYNAELRKAKAAHEAAAAAHDKDLAKLREQETLVRTLSKLGPSNELGKAQARLSTLQDEEIGSRITKSLAGGQVANLESQLLGLEMALGRVASAENRAEKELTDLSAKMGAATANLGALRSAETASGNAADFLAQGLVEAKAALTGVQTSTMSADDALQRVGTTVRQKLLQALKEGSDQLQVFKSSWEAAQRAAGVQGRLRNLQVSRGDDPEEIAKTNAAQREAVQSAKAAKQAYQQQQQALHVLRGAIREAGTDVQALNALFNADTASANRFRGALNALQSTATTAAPAQRQVATAARDTANALDNASHEAGAYEQSLKRLGSSGRETLSMWSRIKGEVIALTLSYVGLYGAMDQLRGVVDTYNKLQAAQVKLSVAFGSTEKAAQEFQWLRQEADRLGLSYIDLANEYSKFAVAINQSPQLAGKARELFLPFAEAGRVLNLTSDDISGVLVAITQMASKGAVSMEELRQQLGDRLVGAFEQMAKALGLSGKELAKLVATGDLAASTALPRLAEQLHKTFGPGVAQSAQTLSAEMARFQNTVADMQSAFANGGFAEALTESLRELNDYFKSDDGKKFFEQLGAAAGVAVKALVMVPKHFDLIAIALATLVGIKASAFVANLNTQFKAYMATSANATRMTAANTAAMNANAAGAGRLRTLLVALQVSTRGVQSATTAASTATLAGTARFNAMAVSVRTLTGAVALLRAGLAALGGPVGIALTAITAAIGYWATATDDATAALDRHDGVLDKVRQKYQAAKGDVKAWSDETRKAAAFDVEQQLQAEKQQLAELRSDRGIANVADAFGNDKNGTVKRLNDLLTALREGRVTAEQFKAQLSEIAASDPTVSKDLVSRWGDLASKIGDAEEKIATTEATLRVINGTASDADKVLGGFADATEEAATSADGLDDALEKLRAKIPSLADEAKKLKELQEIENVQKMVDLIPGIDKTSDKYKELIELVKRARQEVEKEYNTDALKGVMDILSTTGKDADATSGAGMSAALLRKFEGFRSTPYWDTNAYRIGYGSDTVTLADGSVQKVVQGMKIGVEDANRDLVRRIAEFQATIVRQVGTGAWQGMTPQQQAALTSVAYNYGSLPRDIAAAVRTGSAEAIARAIEGRASDNKGINTGRRQTEAAIFRQTDGFTSAADAEKQLQTAKEYHEQLQQNYTLKQKEAEGAKKVALAEATAKNEFRVMTEEEKARALQQQINLALASEEAKARKAGTELTAADRQAVEAATRAEFERAHALDEINAKLRERQEAEKLINSLQSQRQSLTEQIKLAQDSGNNGAVGALKEQLAQVNTQLQAAIQNVITLWQKAGNTPEAAAALQQFQLLGQQIEAANRKGREFLPTGDDINQSLANAFGGTAVDSFISKLQQGQSAMSAFGDTMREVFADFLLQIGKAILKQAILNALQNSSWGGAIAGAVGSVFHSGGIAGETSNRSRTVSPMWFNNAARYHDGGIAGLKPGEVPAILEEGERIRTAEQERSLQERLRAGESGGGGTTEVKVVNAIDSGSFVSAGVNTPAGGRAIMNFMSANKSAVKRALGVNN